MVLVSVMYPGGPEASFDHDYYLQQHIPLVKERWNSMGLEEVRLMRGVEEHPMAAPHPIR